MGKLGESLSGYSSPEYLVKPSEGYFDEVGNVAIETRARDNVSSHGDEQWYTHVQDIHLDSKKQDREDDFYFGLWIGKTSDISQGLARDIHKEAVREVEKGFRGEELELLLKEYIKGTIARARVIE